jgi:hypothetical protein
LRLTARTLLSLIGRVGAADRAAFRRLYAILAPAVLASVRTVLPDARHSMNVLRATFCEVWWMAAHHQRHRSIPTDVQTWITDLAKARGAERRQTLDFSHDQSWAISRALTDALDAHDQWTRLQLASMLNDTEGFRASTPRVGGRSRVQRRVMTSARVEALQRSTSD